MMKHFKNILNTFYFLRRYLIAFLPFLLILTAVPEAQPAGVGRAKYVFLFIGDGMGYVQRNAAETYLAGMRRTHSDTAERRSQLLMNDLPVSATIRTDSLSGVTDSAAAATAIATGNKTVNNAVGMNPQKDEVYESIAQKVRRRGLKVGIVTSAFLQDATPAAFYGHAPKRTDHYALGLQLCESGFDYFGGGGFRNPTGRDKKSASLLDIAAKNGYQIAGNAAAIAALKKGAKAMAIHPKLSAGAIPWAIDGDESSLYLSVFVKKGIELLQDGDGFFLMVEGGKIDLACHANDAGAAIHEVLAFDEALDVALTFYRRHPDETLIVVTSDHETGGMSMNGQTDPVAFYKTLSQQTGSYAAFERTISPKAGAKIEEYLTRAKKFFGDGVRTTEGVRNAFRMSMTAKERRPANDKEYKKLYGPYDPFTMACIREQNAAAGVAWTTFYHTGKDVALTAIGAGAERFTGSYDLAGIHDRLLAAIE